MNELITKIDYNIRKIIFYIILFPIAIFLVLTQHLIRNDNIFYKVYTKLDNFVGWIINGYDDIGR